jgi:hypothetical protein
MRIWLTLCRRKQRGSAWIAPPYIPVRKHGILRRKRIIRQIGADVDLREIRVLAKHVDDVVHRDHGQWALPRERQTVDEPFRGVRKEWIVDKQVGNIGVVLRQRITLDDLNLEAKTARGSAHRVASDRQDFDRAKAAVGNAGAIKYGVSVPRAGIAKNIVRPRFDRTENLPEIAERHRPEAKVLVAETMQQGRQAAGPTFVRWRDLKRMFEGRILDRLAPMKVQTRSKTRSMTMPLTGARSLDMSGNL